IASFFTFSRSMPWSPRIPVPYVVGGTPPLLVPSPFRREAPILVVFPGAADVHAPAAFGIRIAVLRCSIPGAAHQPVGRWRVDSVDFGGVEALLLESGRRQQGFGAARLRDLDRGAAREIADGGDGQSRDRHHRTPLHAAPWDDTGPADVTPPSRLPDIGRVMTPVYAGTLSVLVLLVKALERARPRKHERTEASRQPGVARADGQLANGCQHERRRRTSCTRHGRTPALPAISRVSGGRPSALDVFSGPQAASTSRVQARPAARTRISSPRHRSGRPEACRRGSRRSSG